MSRRGSSFNLNIQKNIIDLEYHRILNLFSVVALVYVSILIYVIGNLIVQQMIESAITWAALGTMVFFMMEYTIWIKLNEKKSEIESLIK